MSPITPMTCEKFHIQVKTCDVKKENMTVLIKYDTGKNFLSRWTNIKET